MAHQHSADFIGETYGAILVPKAKGFNSQAGFLVRSGRDLLLAQICFAHTLNCARTSVVQITYACKAHSQILLVYLEVPFCLLLAHLHFQCNNFRQLALRRQNSFKFWASDDVTTLLLILITRGNCRMFGHN